MGEPLDVLAEAIAVERLDGVDDPRVKLAAALLQQAAVRDLVRERVLEGVLRDPERARSRRGTRPPAGGRARDEAPRPAARRSPGAARTARPCRRRRRPAAGACPPGEPVDARRQHHLDGGRDLDRLDRLRQPIPAALPLQRLRLHQRPDRLLQEERVPALDEELLERRERGIVAEERIQQLAGALGRERVQPHLAVVRLAAPGVLVLGPVVHEQQQARRAQALDQAVEQRLRLAVDPVQVLEDQEERLLARFPQQQAASRRRACAGAAAPGSSVCHAASSTGTSSSASKRRQRRLERAVEREQLARHLLADLAEVVAVLDLEVALEQVDHRQVARRLAVRDRGALEHQPALQAVRVGELVDEARLAHPASPTSATTWP